MNRDFLDCKRRAIEIASLEDPPRNGNGRKRGSLGMLLFGAVEEMHESRNYNQIIGEMIREAALRTSTGAGGPSNVDAMVFKGSLLTRHSRNLGLIDATLL